MKRNSRLMAVVLVLLFMFTACSNQQVDAPSTAQAISSAPQVEVSKEKVKVEYWTWLSNMDMVEEFNKSHEEVEVVHNTVSHPDLMQKLTIALSANSGAPDVFQMTQRHFSGFSSTGQLYDMTDKVRDVLGEYSDGLKGIVTYNDKIYGLPVDVAPGVLWYRKDVFDAAGISAIKTWSEFEAAGEKLRDEHKAAIMPITMPAGTWACNIVSLFLQSRGGNIYTADGKVIKNNTELEFVLEWLNKMRKNEIGASLPHLTPEFWGALKTGEVVGWPMNTAEGANIKKNMPELEGKWSVMAFPKWDDKDTQLTGYWGGTIISIPEQSKLKEQSLSFIKWLAATEEGQVAAGKSWKAVPAMKSAFENEYFKTADPYFANVNIYEQINDVTPFYYYDWSVTEKVIGLQLDLMYADQLSPAETRAAIEENLSKETGR